MCSLFTSQDPASFLPETRALRLHGHVTSIRLERAFWDVIEEIAAREGISATRFCVTLHDEMQARVEELGSFASVLRVTCLHYLRHRDAHAAATQARQKNQSVAA